MNNTLEIDVYSYPRMKQVILEDTLAYGRHHSKRHAWSFRSESTALTTIMACMMLYDLRANGSKSNKTVSCCNSGRSTSSSRSSILQILSLKLVQGLATHR
jgi:hypothetical protein